MKISAVFTKKKPVYNMGYKRAAGERRTIAPSEKYLIASGAAVVLGLAAGALLFRTNSGFFSRGIGEYFLSFSTDFSAKSFPEIFSGFFCANLIYLLVNLILGTSAVGDVPVFFAAFLKSAGIGSLASYLFVKSALKGVEYFLLVVFPGKVILIFAVLLLTQTCAMSSAGVRKILQKKTVEVFDFKLYTLKSALIFAVMLLSCVVDSGAVKLFSPLFSLS